jgi:hypothetical protein
LRNAGIIPEARSGGIPFQFCYLASFFGQVKAAPVFL